MSDAGVAYLLAPLTTMAVIWLLMPIAGRLGLVDSPSLRKAHVGRVPLVGGLAMFIGFAIGALALDQGLTPFRAFFAAGALLVMVGLLDDLHELTSEARFGAQIGAAVMMIFWGGLELADLGGLRPDGTLFSLGFAGVLVTVFAAVGVVNALNMTDGLDGLAGALSLVAALALLVLADAAGLGLERDLLVLLSGVIAGFLVFNLRTPGRRRALVFMGDAGSMFLGFALTWFVVRMSQGEGRAMAPVTALWILMVPLFDTVWLILRRSLAGRSPLDADFDHLHHVLQAVGLGPRGAWCVMVAAALGGAALGLVGQARGWPENAMFYLFLALFALYCVLMGLSWRYRRLLLLWPMDRGFGGGEERRGKTTDRRVRERRHGGDRRVDVGRCERGSGDGGANDRPGP